MKTIENITLEDAIREIKEEFDGSAGVVMIEYILEGYKEIWDIDDALFRRVRDNYSDAAFNPEWQNLSGVLEMYKGVKDEKVNLHFLL